MTTIIFKSAVFFNGGAAFDKIEGFINDFLALLPNEPENAQDIDELLDPKGILLELFSSISNDGGRIGRFFALLIFSAIAVYLASAYLGKLSPLAESAASVVALSPAIYELLTLADEVAIGIGEICGFFSSLTPLLLSVMIAGGGGSASAVSGVQMGLVASAIQAVSSEILLPMVRAVLILGCVSALGGTGAERLARAIKNVFTKGLGLVSTLVSAIFALQSIIAGAADTASLRLAKFTAQSLAPSVGSVIGASMSTLSSGLSYARGIIGAGAIGAIIWIMLSPLAVLMVYRLAIGIASGFAEALGVRSYSKALSAMQYALDGLISVFLVSGILFIFQLVIFIKSGAEV